MRAKRFFASFLTGLAMMVAVAGVAVAQDPAADLCAGTGGTWDSGTQTCTDPSGRPGIFEAGGLFQNAVNTLLFLVGAIAVIMLIVGAIRYVVSAGDQNAVKSAKDTIVYAIVGVVVAFMAWGVLSFVIDSLGS